MKSKVIVGALLSAGILLTGCNSGSSSSQTTSSIQSYGTQSYGTQSATLNQSIEGLPQVSMSDVELIFKELGDSTGKIDTKHAVDIVLGKDMNAYNKIMALPTTGYQDALAKQQAIVASMPEFGGSLLTTGSREKYNLALFAAIFITNTSQTSSSDGVSQVGDITLSQTIERFAMVSHRFFGDNRLEEQDYTWSKNPSTFMAILNNTHAVGSINDISYNNIHQGPVGDCYFLAVLGGLINQRGAQYVANLINNDNGSYSVNYSNIHSVDSRIQVGTINDLEVAVGAYSGTHGNWLTILEQAFGNILMSDEYSFVYFGTNIPSAGIYSLPTFYTGMVSSKLPIGQYYPAFKFLTGHEVYEFTTDYNDKGDVNFKNVYASDQEGYVNFSAQQLSPKAMIKVIDDSLRDKRVVVLGTSVDTNALEEGDDPKFGKALPKDVVGTHAYTVLGHVNGKFIIRNPWGTNYTVTGQEGLVNGYNMVNGVFEVPDNEVFSIFTSVDIEQLPSIDSTPQVVNGQVVLTKKGKPVFTQGTSSLFAQFSTSNQDYIKHNFTGSINTQPNFFDNFAN